MLDKVQIANKLGQLIFETDEFYWAVAWGTENSLYETLINNRKKIKKVIFGTHFYQTDPNLLQQFVEDPQVHVMGNDANGTFHPKIYFFKKGESAYAVIGSANFTNGGLNKNDEAATLIEGDVTDSFFQDLLNMIDGFWKRGELIKQNFVDNYRLQHKATEKYRRELQKKRKLIKPKSNSNNQNLRQWTWHEYVVQLKQRKTRKFDVRLAILKEAKQLFVNVKSFNELSDSELKAIGGFLQYHEGDSIDWGLFGSMRGSGVFQSVINSRSKFISNALDSIPMSGDITKEHYDKYIQLFEKAFEGQSRQGGVPTASRLLAMKRPDIFICVDSENKNALASDLGFAPSTLNFDKYWDEVIVPITESVWWQATRPSGEDGLLWDGRSAMLDIIYYSGKD